MSTNPKKRRPKLAKKINGIKMAWTLDGKYHADEWPAIVYEDGTEKWYQHGEYHRDGGPAVSYLDGTQYWYQHGKIHREDGPAVTECTNGKSEYEYWIKGVPVDVAKYLHFKHPEKCKYPKLAASIIMHSLHIT
jgi:hypothetical protein